MRGNVSENIWLTKTFTTRQFWKILAAGTQMQIWPKSERLQRKSKNWAKISRLSTDSIEKSIKYNQAPMKKRSIKILGELFVKILSTSSKVLVENILTRAAFKRTHHRPDIVMKTKIIITISANKSKALNSKTTDFQGKALTSTVSLSWIQIISKESTQARRNIELDSNTRIKRCTTWWRLNSTARVLAGGGTNWNSKVEALLITTIKICWRI